MGANQSDCGQHLLSPGPAEAIGNFNYNGNISRRSNCNARDQFHSKRYITFVLNGQAYEVNPERDKLEWDSTLVDYIRDKAGFKGTKTMCREGGCGACTVAVKRQNLQTGSEQIYSVNSCLVPVLCIDGWEITTVEKVGNIRSGLHPIQEKLVALGGSQCGYCTPGMVMAMYALSQQHSLEDKKKLSAQEIEDNLDGNICRCTGYRPILDAFKAFAASNDETTSKHAMDIFKSCSGTLDIEDCDAERKCSPLTIRRSMEVISKNDIENTLRRPIYWKLGSEAKWVKPNDLPSLFEALHRFSLEGVKYRLVAGNTASGVYKNEGPYSAFVDINGVGILQRVTVQVQQSLGQDLVELGGGVTFALAIDALKRSSQFQGFEYTAQLSMHFQRVAHSAVRNLATLAGNLMLKHAHPDFPSDLFVVLEAVGALLTIASAPSLHQQYTLVEFLSLDMASKVILSIQLPKLEGVQIFRSFKISRRFQNSHAIVNAGFLIKLLSLPGTATTIVEKSTLVYGGLDPAFIHARNTENYLRGLDLLNQNVIINSMEILKGETSSVNLSDYQTLLTQSLLFKFLVDILGDKVNALVASAGEEIEHVVTSGKQDYDTDPSQWPLYQPIPKIEAIAQCSGEAEYINDMHPENGELFGAFVLSTVANADLKNIDASQALAMPGVVAFLEAKDIPGVNNYMAFAHLYEPIFASGKIHYAGQAVGLIVAESGLIANKASKKVQIVYENVQKPVLTIQEALKAKNESKTQAKVQAPKMEPGLSSRDNTSNNLVPSIFEDFDLDDDLDCDSKFEKLADGESDPAVSTNSISGEFQSGSQYHFYMETQTCISVPKEDCMKIYSSTQWMDRVQFALSQCLALPSNYFHLEVRRLGGGYGGKISRSAHVACACAIAANHLNRPVRISLDLEANMEMIGGRLPYLTKYQVGFSEAGRIENLDVSVICDAGWSSNEITSRVSTFAMQSCYEAKNWKIKPQFVNTHTAAKTFCRAPGTTEAIAGIEYILDHIAFTLRKDPMEIRLLNLIKPGDPIYGARGLKFQNENLIPAMAGTMDLETQGNIRKRKEFIADFNKKNRWKKRGLSVVPMRYPVHGNLTSFKAHVVVYHVDGSVVVTHSGIEMGQGIHTKVVQVVSYQLRIPLDKIKVRPSNNVVSPNCCVTGGSVTSEYCSFAVMKACRMLTDRMAPVREKLGGNPEWKDLAKECQKANVNLTASYQLGMNDTIRSYDVWGLTATEVQIDCLTGEYKIVRCDLMEDAGKSISPDVDVGQIEGSIIMGFGLWLTEKHDYDPVTGQLLTNRTWNYKPPLPKDIPEDFRVTLLKNSDNPFGVLRSKATGEPAVCMSCSVLLALKWAISSARADAGNYDWFQLNGPVTPEDILTHCLTSTEQFNI